MANQYTLGTDFTTIVEENGTIQNIGRDAVELVSATNATAGEGITLMPGEIRPFNGAIKARSMQGTNNINVVDFKEQAGGGGGSYVLPVATASKLGGVKVGSGLSIDESGVLSSSGGGSYVLPTASASTLGGVKIGDNVTIDGNGAISVTGTDVKAALGTGSGTAKYLREDGTWETPPDTQYSDATTSAAGLMSATDKTKLDGLQNYTLPEADASTLGGVKVGTHLSIDSNGVLSADDQSYSLPTASASTLGGVKVGSGLSIDGNGVLSSTGSSATVASSPGYYARESLATPAKTTITIHPTWLNINNVGYMLTADAAIDLTDSAAWDDSTYTTAANRAGKDFYIYACTPASGDTPDFILSANATTPTGYTASNSRKIGGFHCLCVAVGTITGHTLSGYVAGDILPASVWDLQHRAVSENEGMVWVPGAGKWVDIYLPSWKDGGMASVYGGTIVDGESSVKINGELAVEYFGLVNKEVISRAEFMVAMAGSNQGTNISGSADPGTTGGHKDTANRRMISNFGIEDGCGALWQWGRDTFENYPGSTWGTNDYWLSGYAWQTKPVFNSDIESDSKGQCYGLLRRVRLGASWGYGANCGSRAAYCGNFSAYRNGNVSSRGVSSPRRMA